MHRSNWKPILAVAADLDATMSELIVLGRKGIRISWGSTVISMTELLELFGADHGIVSQ
jgi:hypothetical protein